MSVIERLQSNLPLLRTSANWSVQDLSNKLDITRQTTNNLENRKTKMSRIQYLAIRSVLEYEIQESDNQILSKLLYYLVDHPDEIGETQKEFISQQAKLLSNASKNGLSNEEINNTWISALTMAGLVAVGVAASMVLGTSKPDYTSLSWVNPKMKKFK